MSSGQKSKQQHVIQLRRHTASALRCKEKSIWTEGKMNNGKVISPKFLLVEAVLSTTERNKGEINSPEIEFDRKYVRMTIVLYLSLVASRSPNQEPGHCCTITTQKGNKGYQSIKQKKQQEARCKQ